jgi:3'-phosphoadenosine 5'-phosphosulfate sulfotransferase (PAPS reductase)/FAD synthetase
MLVASFSGGRSSAMMISQMDLSDATVIFCNTGKEMPQTLDFVRDCEQHWQVPIVWLEYRSRYNYSVVSYETASRNGEPFEQLIADKSYLPNMMARFCTSELKVLTIERYLKDKGITEWETAVGIRADEPRRVSKMRQKEGYRTPLADAKVTKQDVISFWELQDFDLQLPKSGYYSNCDLCFLKGYGIKQSLVNENPQLAEWWEYQEFLIGARFRADQPSYKQMIASTASQEDLFGYDESVPCFCGD